MNAPSAFHGNGESILKDLDFVPVYIYSVVVSFRSIEEHTYHLIVACDSVSESGSNAKRKNCVFAAP